MHVSRLPKVNAVLDRLLSDVQSVLGDRFVGLYFYGSLSSGDFDPGSSDIDFLVLTEGELPPERVSALDAMHTRLWAGGSEWAAKLEGVYMPREAIRRFDPDDGLFPCVNEGKFYLAKQGSDWIIQRHILREKGVRLAGPDIRPLIDPVGADELRGSARSVLREWWAPMIHNPGWLLGRDDYQVFAVLSMCRVMFTLEKGEVASKPVSARWMRDAFDGRWRELIDQALAWKHGDRFNRMNEVVEMIRFVAEKEKTNKA
jgi:predicted nucleotidyltransferase